MSLEAVRTLVEVAVSLGMLAALGAGARWYWIRSRWRRFETAICTWARDEPVWDDLTTDEWKSLVAIKLSDALFSPAEIHSLLDLAVLVAKGRYSLEIRGRIQFAQRSRTHGAGE